jgi:hypothetical protein
MYLVEIDKPLADDGEQLEHKKQCEEKQNYVL